MPAVGRLWPSGDDGDDRDDGDNDEDDDGEDDDGEVPPYFLHQDSLSAPRGAGDVPTVNLSAPNAATLLS